MSMNNFHSRSASPMPQNIDYVKEALPYGARLVLQNGNAVQPPFYRFVNGVRRIAPKILYGLGSGAALYGAYKLGQHRDAAIGKFNKIKDFFKPKPRPSQRNLTRSHT